MSYVSRWQGKRDEIKQIAEAVRSSHPQDWANTNNDHASGRDMFIRRVVWACRDVVSPVGPNGEPGQKGLVGCNWKRGKVGDLSLDAIALPNPTGAQDKTGGKPGLEIVDIIGGHGAPGASIVFGDVTQATIDSGNGGGWIEPHNPDTTSLPGSGSGTGNPPPTKFRLPSYGELGDAAFFVGKIGVPLNEDMQTNGEHMNAGSADWIGRAVHGMIERFIQHGDHRDADAIAKKVRNEWRAVMNNPKLPQLP